jgi:pyruvate-ferredoxin/flavodoxin oxidoreductase
VVQNQDSYAQGVAAQRPFYFDHIADLADRAFEEFAALTGRKYARAMGYRLEDADWAIIGQGSVVSNAEAVVDHLRAERGLAIGVLDWMFACSRRPRGCSRASGVAVPSAWTSPRGGRAAPARDPGRDVAGAENGRAKARGAAVPHPALPPSPPAMPDFVSGCFGLGSRDLQPGHLVAAVENMLPGGRRRRQFYLGIDFVRKGHAAAELERGRRTSTRIRTSASRRSRPARTATSSPPARSRSGCTPSAAGAPSPRARTSRSPSTRCSACT